MRILALAVALAVAAATAANGEDNLCYVPGCKCNPAEGDLTDVVCKCVESQVRTERGASRICEICVQSVVYRAGCSIGRDIL